MSVACVFFFFFQAEDGIRDKLVTGVQTCALPISGELPRPHQRRVHLPEEEDLRRGHRASLEGDPPGQRQEGHPVRSLLPRARVPAARHVRGRADLLPEDAQARAQPDRGLLRAGPGLLVRRRPGAGQDDVGGGLQGQQVQPRGQEVSGAARARPPGPGAAAHLVLLWLAAQAPPPVPAAVTVGRVTAVAWPPQADLAVALAEAADRSPPFPRVGALPDRPIPLLLPPNPPPVDSLTPGPPPSW